MEYRSVYDPDEGITSRQNEVLPRFGSRRRCEPSISTASSTFAITGEPSSSNNYNNNNNENNELGPASNHLAPFVPLPIRAPDLLVPSSSTLRPQYDRRHSRRGERQARGGFRPSHRNTEQEKLSVEVIEKLKKGLLELANDLRGAPKNATRTDKTKEYTDQVMSNDTVKIYDPENHGFKILGRCRSEREKLEIMKSNKEILDFAYHQSYQSIEWNTLNSEVVGYVKAFVEEFKETSFRHGAFSLSVDFDDFPPGLMSRSGDCNNQPILLRPVVIDGIAVQHASTNDFDRPFLVNTRSMYLHERVPYCHTLNLSVKPLFDVIMAFVIRGHKTIVYLPTYYKNYVTKGGISKVDDLAAFETLIELGFIEFREATDRRHRGKWFNVMTGLADEKEAVFVSSDDYRPKTEKCDYSKPSGRVLTPCFLNTDDRLMVIQPTIRYKSSETSNSYRVITAGEILSYPNTSDPQALVEQLYLSDQIRLTCSLCQLYPMKSLHKVGIKQLLFLSVHARSNFEMPFMQLEDYEQLKQKFSE